jgi:hypothetical protein
MVAYSFQRQFIDPIVRGSKVQTIRAPGKRRHAHVGSQLQLYFAMRTQYCRKIIDDQTCTRIDEVRLDLVHGVVTIGPLADPMRCHFLADRRDVDRFAVLDGFDNWKAMTDFWAQFHPGIEAFEGVMPGWRPGFWE